MVTQRPVAWLDRSIQEAYAMMKQKKRIACRIKVGSDWRTVLFITRAGGFFNTTYQNSPLIGGTSDQTKTVTLAASESVQVKML